MKKLLLVVSIFSFISKIDAQQCWPSGWSKGLSYTKYSYTFQWPSDFGSMSNLTPQQTQSEISSAVASAFSIWGNATGMSYGSGGHTFTIRFEYTYSGGRYSNTEVIFDLASPVSFSTPFPSDRFYFLTIALHEIGNAFVGGDHHNDDDPNSAMHTVARGRVVTGLSSCDQQAMSALYYYTALYNNEFEAGLTGGTMKVNGATTTLSANGSSSTWNKNDVTKTLEAIDQQAGSYFRLFNIWKDRAIYTKELALPKITDSYIASFKKQFNIQYNGSVVISYVTYQPNQTYYAREDNPFSAYANPKTENSIYYVLDQWKRGTYVEGTDNPHTFSPSDHTTYDIIYKGIKPTNGYRNLRFNDSEYGSEVRLTWNKHPFDNSQITHYAIWRKVRHNGVTGSPVQIGTVSANSSITYSFTDYDYLITNGYTDDLLYYDVRGYYSPNTSYSDEDFAAVYGEQSLIKMNESKLSQSQISAEEFPTEYSIGNFPNPFNPTTTIKYQLPEAGMVTLKIYDILGREVADLVNETKAAGYYEVNFDASRLTSGVYIYTIQTGKYTESKKMILAK